MTPSSPPNPLPETPPVPEVTPNAPRGPPAAPAAAAPAGPAGSRGGWGCSGPRRNLGGAPRSLGVTGGRGHPKNGENPPQKWAKKPPKKSGKNAKKMGECPPKKGDPHWGHLKTVHTPKSGAPPPMGSYRARSDSGEGLGGVPGSVLGSPSGFWGGSRWFSGSGRVLGGFLGSHPSFCDLPWDFWVPPGIFGVWVGFGTPEMFWGGVFGVLVGFSGPLTAVSVRDVVAGAGQQQQRRQQQGLVALVAQGDVVVPWGGRNWGPPGTGEPPSIGGGGWTPKVTPKGSNGGVGMGLDPQGPPRHSPNDPPGL